MRWLETLKLDIPQATGDLRRAFQVESDLYGQTKTFKFGVYTPYAEFVLEFGRQTGRRPPWDDPKYGIKQWAMIKGIPLRKARAWWWRYSRRRRIYRSPRGKSLLAWWSEQVIQCKYVLERELKAHLQAAGFNMQDVRVSFQ